MNDMQLSREGPGPLDDGSVGDNRQTANDPKQR